MSDPAGMSIFALTTSAYEVAEFLEVIGSREKAAVIRELIKRAVPTKIVPSRGTARVQPKPVSEPAILPVSDGKVWCGQCDRRVPSSKQTTCSSRFCSLRKSA